MTSYTDKTIDKSFDEEMKIMDERIGLKMRELAKRITAAVQREIVSQNLLYTNSMHESIATEVMKVATGYALTIASRLPHVENKDFSYATVMHEGREIGSKRPPLEAIRHWVMVKGLTSKYAKTDKLGRTRRTIPADYDDGHNWDEIDRVAIRISKSISKKGIHGIKFFDLAMDTFKPKIDNLFSKL